MIYSKLERPKLQKKQLLKDQKIGQALGKQVMKALNITTKLLFQEP